MILLPLFLACTAPSKGDSDTAPSTDTSDTQGDSEGDSDSAGDTGDTNDTGDSDSGAPSTAGTLDPEFGVGGVVTFDSSLGNDRGRTITQQADGKILAAGKSDDDFLLLRLDSVGGLDPDFGAGGVVTTDFGDSGDEGKSVRVQADQHIVLAGITTRDGDGDFGIARYDPDGALDPGFNGRGYAHADIYDEGRYDEGKALAILDDGTYLIGGKGNSASSGDDLALARYGQDGELDRTFGNLRAGVSTFDLDVDANEGNSVTVYPGGILLAGYSSDRDGPQFALLRADDAGQIDPSFGDQGFARVDIGGDAGVVPTQQDIAFSVLADSDTIVLAGISYDGARNRFAAAQLDADGVLDTDFADAGIFTMPIGTVDDTCVGAALQADGKIILVGSALNSDDSEVIVLRLLPDGSLDGSFGEGGVARFTFGGDHSLAYSVALQADGKILVVGDTNNGADIDVAVARLLVE